MPQRSTCHVAELDHERVGFSAALTEAPGRGRRSCTIAQVSRPTSLTATPNATREQIAALELETGAREKDLAELKSELVDLQRRYLEEIGPLYAELIPLDAAVAEAEMEAGLRVRDSEESGEPSERVGPPEPLESAGCGAAATPSNELKRMFRDIARSVHPDTAHPDVDERTRFRRHSLMAEANRAYAERDEDRLRLILRAWELDPDFAASSDPDEEAARQTRRAARLAARLVEIESEFADLRRSAIFRLREKIDDTQRQGWDLFAEMRRQVEREIAMGKATLAKLQRRRARLERRS